MGCGSSASSGELPLPTEDLLRDAVRQNDLVKVTQLLHENRNQFTSSANDIAIESDNAEVLVALITQGRQHQADVAVALEQSVRSGSYECVKALLSESQRSRCECGKALLAENTLKQCALDALSTSPTEGDEPATLTGETKQHMLGVLLVEAVLRAGCSSDVLTELLDKALSCNNPVAVNQLLDAGATIDAAALLEMTLAEEVVESILPGVVSRLLGFSPESQAGHASETLERCMKSLKEAISEQGHFPVEVEQFSEDSPVVHVGKQMASRTDATGSKTAVKYFGIDGNTKTALELLQRHRHTSWAQIFKHAITARLEWAAERISDAAVVRFFLFLAANAHMSDGGCFTDETLELNQLFGKVVEAYSTDMLLPECWNMRSLLTRGLSNSMQPKLPGLMFVGGNFVLRLAVSHASEDFQWLQSVMKNSFVKKKTRDRKGAVPEGVELVSALQIVNCGNWKAYARKRRKIIEDMGSRHSSDVWRENLKTDFSDGLVPSHATLDSSVFEKWLWHGTSHQGAFGITTGDFMLKKAGTHAGTLYGNGIYLAESIAKSDEYTQSDVSGLRPVILCRVALGNVLYTAEDRPDTNALEAACREGDGTHHSVLGDREACRGTFRELIVYDDDQAYPAYLCFYRRIEKSAGPDIPDHF